MSFTSSQLDSSLSVSLTPYIIEFDYSIQGTNYKKILRLSYDVIISLLTIIVSYYHIVR